MRTDKFTIFEVPLGGDVKKYASIQSRKDGVVGRSEMKKINTKLILKRNNETGEYIYFIATMVGQNEDRSVKWMNYTNNRSFTGHIFISDLNGLWVGLYKCSAGVRQSINMDLDNYKSLSNNTKDGMSIQMFATPATAYSAGEGFCERLDPKCEECLYGGAICNVCHYCHIGFDDVVVTPKCSKCDGPKSNCYCCWTCGQYPCQCYPDYGCSYCGSYYCNGDCQSSCYYCGSRYCSGSCQSSGGGGAINPPIDPEKPCGDAKCPTCKKCLNPTKPNCSKCECCRHGRCSSEGCGKLIRPATRAAMNCTHPEDAYCKSTGPVCECGERHVDNVTGIPQCSIPLAEGTYIYDKSSAYKVMWLETVKTGKEYAGYLLADGRVSVNIDARNTSTISYSADYTKCKNNKYSVVLYDKGKKSVVNLVTNIHTHPQIIPDDQINSDSTITAKNLRISYDLDIPTLKKMKFNYGLILNNYKVFKYYQTSSNDSAICHFIESF